MKKHVCLAFVIVFAVAMCGHGQTQVPSVIVDGTYQLDSKLMGRRMPYHVILPAAYHTKTESGRRYPVIYLLHGLTGNFTNWPTKTPLAEYASELDAVIVSVEGENGWYTDNLVKDGQAYESYIIRELIPEVDKKFRTLSRRDMRSIAGLSMGGYGAIKFGIKYPEMFYIVGSFSGALGAASYDDRSRPSLANTIAEIMGPVGSETRKSNDIFFLIRNATPEKLKELPFIYFDCGTEDFLFKTNREFADLLLEKKLPHEFRQLPGAHNWQYWNAQVDEFLRITGRKDRTLER